MSQYKYYIPSPTPLQPWKATKPERAKCFDNVLIDIIDNGMMHAEACRKNGIAEQTFTRVVGIQRKLGLIVPATNGGFVAKDFDPNGIFKYWVKPASHKDNQSDEYGHMMDKAIQDHIEGMSGGDVAKKYDIFEATFFNNIKRLREAGSPIPYLPARACGHITQADHSIFEFSNGKNKVKASVIQKWVEKRLAGYPASWIAGEYRVSPWTVSRLTKPYLTA